MNKIFVAGSNYLCGVDLSIITRLSLYEFTLGGQKFVHYPYYSERICIVWGFLHTIQRLSAKPMQLSISVFWCLVNWSLAQRKKRKKNICSAGKTVCCFLAVFFVLHLHSLSKRKVPVLCIERFARRRLTNRPFNQYGIHFEYHCFKYS